MEKPSSSQYLPWLEGVGEAILNLASNKDTTQIVRIHSKTHLRLPLVISKATLFITAPVAASLVSDQDYSLRPNRHILNTRPPPSAAVY